MSDKILTEAFDKIKAIEESEDPFCVNENHIDEGDSGQLEHKMEELLDGIDEVEGIQTELFELIERLDSAIRDYAPDQLQYWKAYGLAQLSIVAGSEEYPSNDNTLTELVSQIKRKYQETKAEFQGDDDEEELSGITNAANVPNNHKMRF